MDDYAGGITTTGVLEVLGNSISAENEVDFEWDYFRMELDPFTEYWIVVADNPTNRPGKGVYFYDWQGEYVNRSENVSTDNHYFRTHGGGTYYVGVSGAASLYDISLVERDAAADEMASALLPQLNGNRFFSGSIFSDTDVDWYRLDLKANTLYDFHALGVDTQHGSLADPVLKVYDRNGVLIVEDDNSGTGNNALLSFTTTDAGSYFFEVTSATNETGSYHVVSDQFDDWDSQTGSKYGQLMLNDGGTSGSIDYVGDNDWFEIKDLVLGNVYEVVLESPDAVITLLGQDRREFFGGGNKIWYFSPDRDSDLFVQVQGDHPSDYKLQFNDIDDFSADTSTRGQMGIDAEFESARSYRGQLDVNDVDWFSVSGNDFERTNPVGGGLYSFEVVPETRFDQAINGSVRLSLYDPSMNVIATGENALTFRLPATGEYFVSVEGVDPTTSGQYLYRSGYIDTPVDPITSFQNGTTEFVGAIDFGNDRDLIQIDLIEGKSYSILRSLDGELISSGTRTWFLFNPDGTSRRFSSSENQQFANHFVAPVTGRYTIVDEHSGSTRQTSFPYGYRYQIDQDSYRARMASSESVSESAAQTTLAERFFIGDEDGQYEIYSTMPLVHSGTTEVPANTVVALNSRAELDSLEFPGSISNEKFELSFRARQPDGNWESWSRASINGLLAGVQLLSDPEAVSMQDSLGPIIHFSFADELPSYYLAGEIDGFQKLSETELGLVHHAHGRWNSDMIRVIRAQETFENPEIMIFKADIADDVMVFAPGEGKGHDIVINSNSAVMQDLTPGTEGFYKVLRAVGKALGFQEQPALDGKFSIMGTHDTNLPYPLSPLLFDVEAFSNAYNRIGFFPSISDFPFKNDQPFFGMHSGFDIDASAATVSANIDIRHGYESTINDPAGTFTYVSGDQLRNAVGTAFDDRIVGNEDQNRLSGGDGNDRIFGRQGFDQLDGGLGHDVYMFAPGDGRDIITEQGTYYDTLRIDGLNNLDSVADDLTFERLGADMLIRLEWDGQNFLQSDQILIKNMEGPQDRVESLLLVNNDGYQERVSLVSVFDQLTSVRQRFETIAGSDSYGSLVSPVG